MSSHLLVKVIIRGFGLPVWLAVLVLFHLLPFFLLGAFGLARAPGIDMLDRNEGEEDDKVDFLRLEVSQDISKSVSSLSVRLTVGAKDRTSASVFGGGVQARQRFRDIPKGLTIPVLDDRDGKNRKLQRELVEVQIAVEEVTRVGTILLEDEVLPGLELLVVPLPLRVVGRHA